MSILLTSFLVSLIAALWVWMSARKDPHGRPWFTVLYLGMLLVLPLLALLPKLKLELFRSAPGAEGWSAGEGGDLSWVLFLWLAGAVVMLLRVAHDRWLLGRWLAQGVQAGAAMGGSCVEECAAMLGMEEFPDIRVKRGLSSPVVAGLLRPVILVPAVAKQWSDETWKMAILHELGHIQRKDLWLRMAADICCAVHWYNPLVWWMRSKLLTQCEYACDARVIASGVAPRAYVRALCDVVESALQESRPQGVVAMADHAPLKMRVERLMGGARVGRSWLAVVAAVLTTVTALGLTLIRPAAESDTSRDTGGYSQAEIDLRHRADPFPGN